MTQGLASWTLAKFRFTIISLSSCWEGTDAVAQSMPQAISSLSLCSLQGTRLKQEQKQLWGLWTCPSPPFLLSYLKFSVVFYLSYCKSKEIKPFNMEKVFHISFRLFPYLCWYKFYTILIINMVNAKQCLSNQRSSL